MTTGMHRIASISSPPATGIRSTSTYSTPFSAKSSPGPMAADALKSVSSQSATPSPDVSMFSPTESTASAVPARSEASDA